MKENLKKLLGKLCSIKTILALWAVVMISYIVFADKTEFYGIAQLLCSVPLVYTGANVAQKAIFKKQEGGVDG